MHSSQCHDLAKKKVKFRLDNPKYFNFNNLFEISLNGALNRAMKPSDNRIMLVIMAAFDRSVLWSYILRGIDVLMKFRLDNPKYFNFNNLFEISLNGALNRGVFKILIYSKWP